MFSLSLGKIIAPIVCAGVLGLLLVIVQPVHLSGKVISAKTKMPVSDALVAVESGNPNDEIGMGDYVKTDSNGQFTAQAKGEAGARAWKSGYAMASVALGSVRNWWRKEIVIELRELTADNLISEYYPYQGFGIGDGFSFLLGKVVSADSPAADIKLASTANTNVITLEALGAGGIVFQPYAQGTDFYNTPEAPETGYARQWRIDSKQIGLYYVRTRDGRHFAKVRLVLAATDPNKITYWPQWAYQPDGTRHLEIAVGKEYQFPFEKFGLQRESLK